MMNKKTFFYCLPFLLLSNFSIAQEREIAITIDDLPFVGYCGNNAAKLKRQEERIMKILQTLTENNVPATGFVIAGAIENGQYELLERFRDSGITIGNHTYSHKNLNNMSASRYIDDVDRADKKLTSLFSGKKYFRYPYLAEGRGDKKRQVYRYLYQNNYQIAPVTIDTKDFLFNQKLYAVPYRLRAQNLPKIKQRYLDYIARQTRYAEKQDDENGQPSKHILLIHANLLNSYFLPDVIDFYKQRNYRFITLEDALTEQPNLTENGELVSPAKQKRANLTYKKVSYIPKIVLRDVHEDVWE